MHFSSAPPFYSSSSSSLLIPIRTSSILRRRSISIFISSNTFLTSKPRFVGPALRLSASIAERNNLDLSWSSPDPNSDNNYGGWAIVDHPVEYNKRGGRTFLIGSIGASLVALLAAITYFSLSRKGFKFQILSGLHALQVILSPRDAKEDQNKTTGYGSSEGETLVSEASPDSAPNAAGEDIPVHMDKIERVRVPIVVDSTQLEAVLVLKKLKILENDVKANELCSRREYARWLVNMNTLLERNPRHRVIPFPSLPSSINAAFVDVNDQDPDFGSIQALAEAGVIPSKLSQTSDGDGLKGPIDTYFYPERFVSRWDLIEWKARLEYEFVPVEQISATKLGFMDVKEITSDASPELFMDMLAEDKSILRKVFGQSKRFQPHKPSTKAQAAVALTSGKMTEAVYAELSRLGAESAAMQAEMREIRSELLDRGDIKRFWDAKMNEVKIHGFDVEQVYLAAVHDLEQEKIVQEKHFAEHLKEKTAMDCQRQLLLTIREEIKEMSQKLISERSIYVSEHCSLQNTLKELLSKQEEMVDVKSALEAEKEALRILRSWVEDEARKSQTRAKVLEEVERRWKWVNEA